MQIPLPVAILLFAGAQQASRAEFTPGTETKLSVPGLENPVVVYVPENYDASRVWPVVFHYHGTHGRPSVHVPRVYTRGRDFVLVGMEFKVRGRPEATREFYDGELAAFLSVRRLISGKVKIDLDRTYIGGFSKGGWIAATFAESYLPELAGVYVLGAGKPPFRIKEAARSSRRKRSLYIGVGQLEVNYPYGVRAIRYFSRLGFEVTFDGYPGLGHAVPVGTGSGDPFQRLSTAFLQWWEVEKHRTAPSNLRKPVAAWLKANLRFIRDNAVLPRDRFLAASRSKRSPYYRFLYPEQRKEIDGAVAEFLKINGCKIEKKAREKLYEIIDSELTAMDYESVYQAARNYFTVYAKFPETYHGALAGLASLRLHAQVSDLGNWKFATDERRAKIEGLVRDHPLGQAPREDLLNLIRTVERAIRIEVDASTGS